MMCDVKDESFEKRAASVVDPRGRHVQVVLEGDRAERPCQLRSQLM